MAKLWNGLTVTLRDKQRRIDPDYSHFNALVKRSTELALAYLKAKHTEYYPYPNDPNASRAHFEESLKELEYSPNNSVCQKMIEVFDRGFKIGRPLYEVLEESASVISKGYEEVPSGNPREDELVVLHKPNATNVYEFMVRAYSRRLISQLSQEKQPQETATDETNRKAQILELLYRCREKELTDIFKVYLQQIGWRGDMKNFGELMKTLVDAYWIEKIDHKAATTLSLAFTNISSSTIKQYLKNPDQVFTKTYEPFFNLIKPNPRKKDKNRRP